MAVGALGLGSNTVAQASDSSCPAYNVCFWQSYGYQGPRIVFGASHAEKWIYFQYGRTATKNRFTDRLVFTYNVQYGSLGCYDPGESNSYGLTHTTAFYISAPGARCWAWGL